MKGFLARLRKVFHDVGSYELVRSPEKIWGGPDENGDWNGMLGMLQREVNSDRGAAPMAPLKTSSSQYQNRLCCVFKMGNEPDIGT